MRLVNIFFAMVLALFAGSALFSGYSLLKQHHIFNNSIYLQSKNLQQTIHDLQRLSMVAASNANDQHINGRNESWNTINGLVGELNNFALKHNNQYWRPVSEKMQEVYAAENRLWQNPNKANIEQFNQNLGEFQQRINLFDNDIQESTIRFQNKLLASLFGNIIGILALAGLYYLIRRNLLRPMKKIQTAVCTNNISTIDLGHDWSDLQDHLQNLVPKQHTNPFQQLSIPILQVDALDNIVFINAACSSLLQSKMSEIKKNNPVFNADVLGKNIAVFNSKEFVFNVHSISRQSLLGDELCLEFFNTPINKNGDFEGAVISIIDRSEEIVLQKDLENCFKGFLSGNLKMRLANYDMTPQRITVNEFLDSVGPALQELMKSMESWTTGDLSATLKGEYKGIFGEVKNGANEMCAKLGGIVSKMQNAVCELESLSEKMSQSSEELSSSAERQASSLEETAASMEEISATVKNNSQNAQRANKFASESSITAEKGVNAMADAVTAMKQLQESSNKISEIVSVIDAIAFQTNLLALNAAVEAARAGDAGKGFAVVADEVRSLAQRSAQSSKEIRSLIETSSLHVKNGVGLVNNTGDTLSEMMHATKNMSEIIAEIAQSSTEQSNGIEQINDAISQIDGITQKNATMAHESNATSSQLATLSRNLKNIMQMFNSQIQNKVAANQTRTSQGDKAPMHSATRSLSKPTISKPLAARPTISKPLAARPTISKPGIPVSKPPVKRPTNHTVGKPLASKVGAKIAPAKKEIAQQSSNKRVNNDDWAEF